MKKNRTFAEKKRKHFGKEVPQSVSHDFPRSNDYFTVSHGFIISVVFINLFFIRLIHQLLVAEIFSEMH